MTINDLLKRIDDYAAVIRAYRPLSEAEVKALLWGASPSGIVTRRLVTPELTIIC